MEKWRDRKFRLLLYPDNPEHLAASKKIMENGANYAMILHNKDPKEDNPVELKKEHWHIVLRFKNAVWSTAIAKEYGIEERWIMQCDNLDGALLYLVHYNQEEKGQYDLEEVSGPLKTRLAYLLADDDESTRALNIYEIIRNSPGFLTYSEVFLKACKAGLYGDFRRMGNGVKWLIDDHNEDWRADSAKRTDHDCRLTFNTMQKGAGELRD